MNFELELRSLSKFEIQLSTLFYRDGTKLTILVAGTALDALRLVDDHRGQLVAGSDVVGTGDGLGGAVLGALAATDALLGVDDILHEFLADAGAALLVHDVLHVLIPEVVEGRENGVGRGLAEAAEGAVLDDGGQVAQGIEVVHRAVAVGDLLSSSQRRLLPMRQGLHLPQLSSQVNSR